MKDEILEELWKAKDQITAESGDSTKKLFDRLRAIKLSPSQRRVDRSKYQQKQRA